MAAFCFDGPLYLNEKGVLNLDQKHLSAHSVIGPIDEWIDTLTIHASVYLREFPAKNAEILKHMSIIMEAAFRYPVRAWNSYSQLFRLRQANEKTRQAWSSLNSELWLRVISNPF